MSFNRQTIALWSENCLQPISVLAAAVGGGGGGGEGGRLAGGKWEESNLSRGLANSVCVLRGNRGSMGLLR